MHSVILNDTLLRELALAQARNEVGPNHPISVVLNAEGISQAEYDKVINKNPTYHKYVEQFRVELSETGFSFAAKARVLAESLLPNIYAMIKDTDVPAVTRMKGIENLVKWGDLEPKTNQIATAGAGFSISINIPSHPTLTINASSKEIADDKAPVFTLPAAEPKKPTEILFDEPADYEYAGDDVYN